MIPLKTGSKGLSLILSQGRPLERAKERMQGGGSHNVLDTPPTGLKRHLTSEIA